MRQPAALVIAHPGHELRVHGWLERTRPRVYVLTDGSGGTDQARLPSTTQVLAAAGAPIGSVYGRWPDKVLYRALLEHDYSLFHQLSVELADDLERHAIRVVVADAAEAYNPVHDVCRLVVDTAVALLLRPVKSYDFPLVACPDLCPAAQRKHARWLRLSPAELQRKLQAARAYPEMATEVETALAQYGPESFAVECLRPVLAGAVHAAVKEQPPAYEHFGQQRVADGRYEAVIRYREHLAPLAAALEKLALDNMSMSRGVRAGTSLRKLPSRR